MYKRIFAWILTLVMVFSLLPGTAMAAENAPETEPVVTEPVVTEPQTTEPKTTEPKTTEPKATEPKATEPEVTEPEVTEPEVTEPEVTEPEVTEPEVTEPEVTEPEVTEPEVTEPEVTEPEVTEPEVTEPEASEPEETEPQATQPAATEPAPDQKIKFTNPGKRDLEPPTITAHFTFEFPEDSDLTEWDVGSSTVVLSVDNGLGDYDSLEEAEISEENGWTAFFELNPNKNYKISVAATYLDGYTYSVSGDPYVCLEAGEDEYRDYIISYAAAEEDPDDDPDDDSDDDPDDDSDDDYYEEEEYGTLTISLVFAEDSAFGDADIGAITANIYDDGEELVKLLILTQENGRTVTTTLRSGEYYIEFTGYEKEGYVCGLEQRESIELSDEAEETVSRQVNYVKDEATLTVSLAFAEGSAFGDADIGAITANIYDGVGAPVKTFILTQENGRTATATLPSGYYEIVYSGYKKVGYLCGLEQGESIELSGEAEETVSRQVNYVKDEATLTVSLAFAEGSACSDTDIGDITVIVDSLETGKRTSAELTSGNGRTAVLTLPSGNYGIEFSGYEKDGYACDIDGSEEIVLSPGENVTEAYTLNYIKDEAPLTLSLVFAEDSVFGDGDIGEITAKVYAVSEEESILVRELSLTRENGRTDTVTLPSGEYSIKFSGHEKDGYVCGLEEAGYVTLDAGTEVSVSREVNYTEFEANLTISLVFGEDSEITDVDFENISVTLRDSWEDTEVIETKNLNSDGNAAFSLPSRTYYVTFSGYKRVDGYYFRIEGAEEIEVPQGEAVSEEYTVSYVKEEATLTVTLNFAEDSELGDDDIGDITAEIYDDDPEDGGELVGTLVLSKENGRKGQLTVPAEGYYYSEMGEWVSHRSYHLKFTGSEKEGYRCQLAGADYTLEPVPGDEDGWNVIAKYVKAEHKVTVNVRLSEDSDVPAAELKNCVSLNLAEINEGLVEEAANHPGSTVFTHTFTDLPASDCYRLNVSYFGAYDSMPCDATLQSITCTGEELYKDLEEGQLDFRLDSDCEIDVVLLAKRLEGEATVIVRFTQDSALQAEDFPEGIKLIAASKPQGGDCNLIPGGETVFSQEANWTKTVKIPGRHTHFDIPEHPEGYVGTVTLSGLPEEAISVNPEDCPITVYADICFVERKSYYLDVEFVFAEDSALKGADAGSIFLDINDDGTERSFEFKEGSWRQTVELHGDPNGIKEGDHFGWALSGLVREGYGYTVRSTNDSDYDWESAHTGIPLWERGETVRLVLEVCYTPEPGKLVVNIVSSPYGEPCTTTITVTDADGNVVAEEPVYSVSEFSGEVLYHCVIDLPGTGTYTVSQSVEEDTYEYMYFADGPKTVQFDPAKGATVTLLNERRGIANLTLRKFFENRSILGPEDFPDGVTVTLTEATGTFSGTYTLSDANGWSVSLEVPAGSYTATEANADKDGFARTTRFVFTQRFYDAGASASLRDWGLRSGNTDHTRASTTYDAVGGPYYIFDATGAGSIYNSHWIDIYNTYERAGSISFTAGDGFYNYPDEQLPGSLGTGYEAEQYQYTVVINGEEQTVTLKPGETHTLENLPKGTEYSVVPVLPDGYTWNTDDAAVSGTIGSDVLDDESWDVEIDFENLYYYAYEDGILTIVKTDSESGEGLAGAVFGLYTDAACTDEVATATSGEDGICSFTITEEGTYYIKELEAPTQYHVLDETVHTVTVTAEWELEEKDGTKVIVQKLSASVADLREQDGGYTWVNERRTGSITITAGDGFWIYGGEELDGSLGTGYEAEEYSYRVVIDDQEQTVTLKPGEEITIDGIAGGAEYTVTPVLPDGYAWNTDDAAVSGTIGADVDDPATWDVEVSFENLYYYAYGEGTLTIVKTDELTGEKLKGAMFGLYTDAACSKLVTSATTNRDGICSFTLTEEGTFYIKELKAPTDYHELDTTVRTVTVEAEWTLETREGTKVIAQQLTAAVSGLSEQDGGVTWVNERKTTDIRVTKIFAHDEDLERPEYVIAVLYRDGEAYDWAKLSADNNWNYVWKDMPLGFEYTVDEADVPEGYYKQVRSDGYDFTIINSGAIIPQTGDDNMIVFWTAMALVSLCAIAFLTEQKRRQRT